jgi:phosphoribosyl-ATP pyrophosphohydrolase
MECLEEKDIDMDIREYNAAKESMLVLLEDAIVEAVKAIEKYPQPNYVISKVAEEAGEVVKAAIHCAEGRETLENVRKEIVQAIAMLIRLYIEGDQVHKLPPVARVDVVERMNA